MREDFGDGQASQAGVRCPDYIHIEKRGDHTGKLQHSTVSML